MLPAIRREDDRLVEPGPYFRSEWVFARGLTRDLLGALAPDELLWTPGQGIGPLWKHFRHLGRVQQNYLLGLDAGVMAFPIPENRYRAGPDRSGLLTYLDELDVELEHRLGQLDWSRTVAWPEGDFVTGGQHLLRLVSHETLHHGIWIACCRLLGKRLPASWAAWDPEAAAGVEAK